MEAAILRMVGNIVEDESEGFALEVRTIGIVHEIEVHLRLFEDNILDTEPFATDTQRHHADEFFAYLGDFEVNDNLSVRVEPSVISASENYALAGRGQLSLPRSSIPTTPDAYGLKLALRF